jgi:DNA-binding IclR family transcriptional regulator
MVRQILSLLDQDTLSKAEIARNLGKSKPTRYLNELVASLLRSGLLERTIPEKPNSRLQKYRLTPKGLKSIHSPDP